MLLDLADRDLGIGDLVQNIGPMPIPQSPLLRADCVIEEASLAPK
jgi:hypothetical protein